MHLLHKIPQYAAYGGRGGQEIQWLSCEDYFQWTGAAEAKASPGFILVRGWEEGERSGKAITKGTAHLQSLNAILFLVFLGRFDKVAVVAALFQFHHNVQETRCAPSCSLRKSLVVSCQNPPTGRKIKRPNHFTVQRRHAGA